MAHKTPDPLLDRLDKMMEIATRLEAARDADPVLANAEIEDLIRHIPGKRAIARGYLGGQAAVFRISLADHDKGLAATWQEMQRLWPYMSEGNYRICEPLHHNPAHGILVIGEVPGTPLLQYIWQTRGPERSKYMRPAAEWMRAATAMSEGWRVASPAGWLARAERSSKRQPFAQLLAFEIKIIKELQLLAKRIEGVQWRTAICHGDLHPNNLITDGDRLTGIDFGGSSRLPIYKDMARFLMHMGRRGLIPSGDRWMGVDRQGAQAFRDAFDLSDEEFTVFLPFMLGVEALIRVEIPELPTSRIKRAERMYKALLQDLRGLDDRG